MQGEVLIKGRRRHGLLSDDPDIGRLLNVGMVFQNGALFDSLTVGENVGFLLYEHTSLSPLQIEVSLQTLLPLHLQASMRITVAQILQSSSYCEVCQPAILV